MPKAGDWGHCKIQISSFCAAFQDFTKAQMLNIGTSQKTRYEHLPKFEAKHLG